MNGWSEAQIAALRTGTTRATPGDALTRVVTEAACQLGKRHRRCLEGRLKSRLERCPASRGVRTPGAHGVYGLLPELRANGSGHLTGCRSATHDIDEAQALACPHLRDRHRHLWIRLPPHLSGVSRGPGEKPWNGQTCPGSDFIAARSTERQAAPTGARDHRRCRAFRGGSRVGRDIADWCRIHPPPGQCGER